MKFFLTIAVAYLSFTNLVAQNILDSSQTKMKLVKEIQYSIENKKLKDRDNLFNSKSYSYRYLVFDNTGNMIETGEKNAEDSLIKKNTYYRNKKRLTLKSVSKNALNEITIYTTHEYNSNDNLTYTKIYDSNNNLIKITSYKYSDNGNKIEVLFKNLLENTGTKILFKYSSNGKLKKKSTYSLKGDLISSCNYRDKRGKQYYKFTKHNNGEIIRTTQVLEHDERGNLVTMNFYGENGEVYGKNAYIYIFDDRGNWITKKHSLFGKLKTVWERKIEYYK